MIRIVFILVFIFVPVNCFSEMCFYEHSFSEKHGFVDASKIVEKPGVYGLDYSGYISLKSSLCIEGRKYTLKIKEDIGRGYFYSYVDLEESVHKNIEHFSSGNIGKMYIVLIDGEFASIAKFREPLKRGFGLLVFGEKKRQAEAPK